MVITVENGCNSKKNFIHKSMAQNQLADLSCHSGVVADCWQHFPFFFSHMYIPTLIISLHFQMANTKGLGMLCRSCSDLQDLAAEHYLQSALLKCCQCRISIDFILLLILYLVICHKAPCKTKWSQCDHKCLGNQLKNPRSPYKKKNISFWEE